MNAKEYLLSAKGKGWTTEKLFNNNINRLDINDIANYMEDYLKFLNKEKEKSPSLYDPSMCVVCHQVPVDVANGYDTCQYCLSKI